MVPMRKKRQLQDVEATVVAFSLGALNGPFGRDLDRPTQRTRRTKSSDFSLDIIP